MSIDFSCIVHFLEYLATPNQVYLLQACHATSQKQTTACALNHGKIPRAPSGRGKEIGVLVGGWRDSLTCNALLLHITRLDCIHVSYSGYLTCIVTLPFDSKSLDTEM